MRTTSMLSLALIASTSALVMAAPTAHTSSGTLAPRFLRFKAPADIGQLIDNVAGNGLRHNPKELDKVFKFMKKTQDVQATETLKAAVERDAGLPAGDEATSKTAKQIRKYFKKNPTGIQPNRWGTAGKTLIAFAVVDAFLAGGVLLQHYLDTRKGKLSNADIQQLATYVQQNPDQEPGMLSTLQTLLAKGAVTQDQIDTFIAAANSATPASAPSVSNLYSGSNAKRSLIDLD